MNKVSDFLKSAPGKFAEAQHGSRVEDEALVTGKGRYSDDEQIEGQVYAAFLRAPVAHGEIKEIDCEDAKDAPGVLAVYTGEDLEKAGVGHLPCMVPLPGNKELKTPRPALAIDRVRYVGEPVVAVIAETPTQALDAVELIEADIEPLDAVVDVRKATTKDAMQIWDSAKNNVAFEWTNGDEDAVDKALKDADHVTKLRLDIGRVVGNALEPRASLATYDEDEDKLTLYTGSQSVRTQHSILVNHVFDIDPKKIRVRSFDVGGGFGIKTEVYAESVVVLHAAKGLKKPVKWTGTRSENFLADNQGRDVFLECELGLDKDGRFTALKALNEAGLGAYLAFVAPTPQTRNFNGGLASVYRTPVIFVRTRGIFTNAQPIGPYRGAGRPEATYMLERLVDAAARETGLDAVEIRRINMISPDDMPYETPIGLTYDTGEFEKIMDEALELADWKGFEKRKKKSEKNGKLRGISVTTFLEIAGGAPKEQVDVSVTGDGRVRVLSAAQSNGQGHLTTYPWVMGKLLGVPADKVDFMEGDSDIATVGGGTNASRSMIMVGGAMAEGADKIVEQGKQLAAHFLEADAGDVDFDEGVFRVKDSNKSIGLFDLAKQAEEADLPDDLPKALQAKTTFEAHSFTFPNGCHVCEAEVDPETGVPKIVSYVAVDDCGVVMNETVVHGQVHGGIAQGLGQVLGEECIYDEDGQMITGSFMDYFMPHAHDLPPIKADMHAVPSTVNPLGVKGVGEAGTTGALPAGMNAILDALAPEGVTHLDLPATPVKIWQALRDAKKEKNKKK